MDEGVGQQFPDGQFRVSLLLAPEGVPNLFVERKLVMDPVNASFVGGRVSLGALPFTDCLHPIGPAVEDDSERFSTQPGNVV